VDIQFHFQKKIRLEQRIKLKLFIKSLFKAEKTTFSSLGIIFCTDEFLLDINRSFLNHNYLTDVISFSLSGQGQPVEGEIYISVDRVKENADELGQTFKEELHRVIFHGILHFCGYKDKSPAQKKQIRAKENYYLKKYFR
jgi:rRNA maturation RNase YbeY